MEDQIITLALYAAVPGGAGGVATFLAALQRSKNDSDRNAQRFLVEVLGATVTATFVTGLIPLDVLGLKISAAFAIGTAWAAVLEVLKSRITRIVEAALGVALEDNKQ